MADNFSGDLKIVIDEDGADIILKDGQPVMDKGLENYVGISLFTRKGWAGNVFFRNEEQKIGSDHEVETEKPITLKQLVVIENEIEKALTTEVFGQKEITISNPEKNHINEHIKIQPPGSSSQELLIKNFGINWIEQATDPAYKKI